jgi:hypothetical protein
VRRATALHDTVTRTEYEALLLRIEALEAQRIRRRDDRADGLAIATAVQGRVFSAGELLAHTTVNRDLAQALRGLTTPRQVGKRLRRLAGRDLGGFVLQRVGSDRDGTLWAVQVGWRLT